LVQRVERAFLLFTRANYEATEFLYQGSTGYGSALAWAFQLNYKVEGLEGVAIEEAGTGTDVGEGNPLSQSHYGIADLFHDAADGATGFIGAGALLIKLFTYAANWSEGPFNVTDYFSKGNVFRLASELITTRDPAPALYDACGF